MTTSFPETKEDFTAENGVTYTWDVNRWRTKAYKLDDSKLDEYLPLTGGDLSGKLTVRKIREDRNTVSMSILGQVRDTDNAIINDVLFKSYQREIGSPQADYVAYYGSGGGANEILNRKTAQAELASKAQVEAGETIQQQVLERVTEGEAVQATLVNKVNALEGSIIDAIWTFEEDDRIPRTGEFALRAGGNQVTSDFQAATVLILNTTDFDGNTYTFERITINDVVRLGAADGSGAEYRITGLAGEGAFTVEHLRSTPDAADEVPYAFTFLSSFDPQGLATIAYVDAQDNLKLSLTGGTMSGDLHVLLEPGWEDAATSKSYVDNMIATNLALVWAQNYATEDYVDQAIADIDLDGGGGGGDYLPLTGGTVDGLTTITNTTAGADNSYVFNVQGERLPEGQTSAFRVTAGGSVKAGHSSTSPFMAVASNDVVTKGFLENAFDEHIVLDDYYTKNEIDQLNDLSLKRFGNNDVATGEENESNVFRIRGIRSNDSYYTCISISGGDMGLYNLREPQEDHHAATRGYVDGRADNKVAKSGVSQCASNFRLSGTRANGNSYSAIQLTDDGVNIFNLREPTAPDYAATKKYVDESPAVATTGTATNPTLQPGQLYWNTTNKVLYIGN
jgi:hypothetical protein